MALSGQDAQHVHDAMAKDKAAQKGVLKAETASRKISRLTKQVAGGKSAAPAAHK